MATRFNELCDEYQTRQTVDQRLEGLTLATNPTRAVNVTGAVDGTRRKASKGSNLESEEADPNLEKFGDQGPIETLDDGYD